MYRHVMVTLDGSQTSEAVLPAVEHLVEGKKMRITLLTVAEVPEATAETPQPRVVASSPAPGGVATLPAPRIYEDRTQALERIRDELQRYLDARAQQLRESGIQVDAVVAFGEPAEEILATARAREVDLIAMATHGRTGLAQVVFGSVAARVVGSGMRPVLLVRPDRLSGSTS